MKPKKNYQNLTIIELEERIKALNAEVDEEYRKLGKQVPDYIITETKPVNSMIDEIIMLQKILNGKKEGKT